MTNSPFATAQYVYRQIPPQHKEALLKGTLKLAGSVLRNTKTGQIVAHLQEATPIAGHLSRHVPKTFPKFASISASTGNPIIGATAAIADLAMQAGQLAQGEAIRSGVNRVEAGVTRLEDGMGRIENKIDTVGEQLGSIDQGMDLLQNLGITNLAFGAASLGVSMVGFGIMAIKLNRVQESIHSVAGQLDAITTQIDRLRQEQIDADFVEIQSLCNLYEEAWNFTDKGRAEQQWLRIAHETRSFQDRFAWRARELLMVSSSDPSLADPMLDALSLASGIRVAALIACNESALASTISSEAALQLETLTGSIGLLEMSSRYIPSDIEVGTADYEFALASARETAKPLLSKIRHREACAATNTAFLPELEKRRIAPREWLEEARNERESSVLLLSFDGEE